MAHTQIDYNLILQFMESRCLYIISAFLFCLLLFMFFKSQKKKKLFYNTGFKIIASAWDRCKLKIRLGDFDDKYGVRYIYLFEIKIFGFDFYRIKYIDQNGKVFKRKIRFGGK